MATSMTSDTLERPSTATMSGRGTITSRTTVSPNSMMEWISWRSCDSISPSSTATSAMASSSSSETNGPAFRPLPGRMMLDTPIRPRASNRNGGKLTSAWMTGAVKRAARSECWTAHVLGAASANTKMITTSNSVAMAMPHGPKTWSATMPTRVAATSVVTRSRSSTGFSVRSGCSSSLMRVLAPGRPSSAMVNAFTRLVRVNAVSERARNAVNAMSTATKTSIHTSPELKPCVSARILIGRRSPFGPVEAVQQRLLARLHDLRLGVLGVVHPEQVQHAVHDQQGQFVLEGAGVVGGVAVRHRGTDHDVAQQRRHVVGLAGKVAGTAAAGVRGTTALHRFLVDREREHVGGSVLAQEALVEVRDGVLVHEQQGDLRIRVHALGRQHRLRQPHPAHGVDRELRLLVGRKNVHRHARSPAAPMSPAAPVAISSR